MPLYHYRCPSCNGTIEVLAKMKDPAPKVCPHCDQNNHDLIKLLAPVADTRPTATRGAESRSSETSAAAQPAKPAHHSCSSFCRH